MKYYSKFLTFLLVSSSALSMTLLPSHAMEEKEKENSGPSYATRSVEPDSPSQDEQTTQFIPECFVKAAEFEQHSGRITPSHVLNRYLLLGSYLGNHSEEKRKDLARGGIQSFIDQNYVQAKPSLEKAALYGDFSAMIHLGHIYKSQGNLLQALQWYTLSLQTTWESTGKSNPAAIKFLKQLNTPEANEFLKISALYAMGKNPIVSLSLYNSYVHGNLESYLSQEERILRGCKLSFDPSTKFGMGQKFLQAQIGTIYPQDIRFKRAAQLFCEANDSGSLECLGNMLYDKKITLIELHQVGALPQILKELKTEELTCLTNLDGATILWALASTPPACHVLGALLPNEPNVAVILQKMNFFGPFLEELGIAEASLTHYELSALIYARTGLPDSLFNLADNLHKHKLTLQNLKERGAYGPLLKLLGLEESSPLCDVSLAAILYLKAGTLTALNSLGYILHKRMITIEELKTIGVLSQVCKILGIKESPSLKPSTLAVRLFAKARTPEALINLGFMLYKQMITIEALKTIGVLLQILDHLEIKASTSLTNDDLAALLFERAETPYAFFNLGNMFWEKKVTVNKLRSIGVLPRLLDHLGIIDKPSLTNNELAAFLYERAGTPESLFNLGLLYLSDVDPSKEEKIQKAEKSFRAANTGDAKNALAYMYLTGLLEESLDISTRCQKAFSLLESALLEGSEKAKELLKLAVELFVLEQEKISALENEESVLPALETEDLYHATDEFPPLLESNEQAIALVHSEQDESSVVPAQGIDSREKEASKDKNRKIVRKKENHELKKERKRVREQLKRTPLIPITEEGTKPQNFDIEFVKPKVKKDYNSKVLGKDSETSKKIQQLIDDIKNNPLDDKGRGKPKPLKGPFLGWWERYIDGTNRLVYRIRKGKIIIYSFEGHLP